MTATVAADSRISHDEYRILSRFVDGKNLRQIAAATGAPVKAVQDLIELAADNDRGKALKLVDEYEQAQSVSRAVEEATEARGELVENPELVLKGPDDIPELLDAAFATADPELVGHAGRINSLIGDLRRMLHEHTARAEIRAALVDEAQRLENRITEIRAQLDSMGGTS